MKTITAVELRKNMGEIFRRVQNGEEVSVTYRDQISARIVAVKPRVKNKSRPSGLDILNAAPRKGYKFDPEKSTKELYHEMLNEKYAKHVT